MLGMSMTLDLGLLIGALSAFVGALSGVGAFGFWLSQRLGGIHSRIDEHEKLDIQRFADLRLAIVENRIQAQTIEAVKEQHHNRTRA